jgi:4-carboxymuconolactone decarboxylase
MTSELYRRGLEVRTEVLGKEYVEAAIAGADAFNRPFQELVTTACWGGVWADETLSRRQRSLLVLAMTAALNRPHEFRTHFRGALNNGCTLAELRATLMQVAIYCGMPAGVEAFRLAREVLREAGVDVGSLEDGP